MTMTRRNALALAAMAALPASRVRAQSADKLKLGIITDLSGPYADLSRPSLACAQQAVEDFGAVAKATVLRVKRPLAEMFARIGRIRLKADVELRYAAASP